jgi:glycosyltransferase involved in cell wall biosynthesis
MVTVADLMCGRPLVGPGARSDALVSVVILCQQPEDETGTRAIVELLQSYRPQIEIVVVIEPAFSVIASASQLGAWCARQDCRVIEPEAACGLPGLRFNEGILASGGRWVWLLEARGGAPASDIGSLLGRLGEMPSRIVPVLVRPEDDSIFLAIPGVEPLWLDLLYQGWKFPFANVMFAREVFTRHGLLDPHVAAAPFYQQEFLHRIGRFVEFEKFIDAGAAVMQAERFTSLFYYWLDIDRNARLQPRRLPDYAVDDLDQFNAGIPEIERQHAFIHSVLPYYYRYRHRLTDGLPTTAQSWPARTRHVLGVKGDHYTTTIDVTIRNFDVWSQGRRQYKLSHVFVSQIDAARPVADDAVLLQRTTEAAAFKLMEQFVQAGLPVGYALDDDLFHLAELGGVYATFRQGDPGYDAMVGTIRAADVVLCGGAHVERVVREVNPRTVQFDASVLPQFLPDEQVRARQARPFKFGYAGGSYRIQEMQMLWPAIEQIRREYGDRVSFEFWGLDPNQVSKDVQGISFVPFSISYYEYLARLQTAGFHAMLVPLLSQPAARRGKLPVKVWETAVAGAVGLYSDVPTYEIVNRLRLGLSVAENTDAWYQAMRSILDMDAGEYARLQERSLEYVREFYSTPAMLPVHEHGLAAILFHGATRAARDAHGRPCVLFVLPAAVQPGETQSQIARVMELAEQSAIRPEVFQLTSASAGTVVRAGEILAHQPVALVHMFGYEQAFGQTCAELNIPVVITLPAGAAAGQISLPQTTADQPGELIHSYGWRAAEAFGSALGRHWFSSREVVPAHLFDMGFDRLSRPMVLPEPGRSLSIIAIGAVEPANHVIELEQALSSLVTQGHDVTLTIFGGSEATTEYAEQCRRLAAELGLADRLSFRGALGDIAGTYAAADILVSVSTRGGTTAIYEAMASGVLVVAWPGNSAGELLAGDVNCIRALGPQPDLLAEALDRAIRLTEAQRFTICRHGFRLVRQECHPRRGRLDLLALYNTAIQIRRTPVSPPRQPLRPKALPAQSRGVKPGHPPASYVPLRHSLVYHVVPEFADWMGLDILIATHGRAARGNLILRIWSDQGQLLRQISADLSDAHDNDWLQFRFAPILNCENQQLQLQFVLVRADRATRISLFETNLPEHSLRRWLRKVRVPLRGNSLYCQRWYSLNNDNFTTGGQSAPIGDAAQ